MDKNQREERRRQEDIALNRGLLWVGAAILMELLLMLVNKYYINYYSTVESHNMVYAFDAGLKAVRIVALIAWRPPECGASCASPGRGAPAPCPWSWWPLSAR